MYDMFCPLFTAWPMTDCELKVPRFTNFPSNKNANKVWFESTRLTSNLKRLWVWKSILFDPKKTKEHTLICHVTGSLIPVLQVTCSCWSPQQALKLETVKLQHIYIDHIALPPWFPCVLNQYFSAYKMFC